MSHQTNYIRTIATIILVALSPLQGILAQDEIVLPAPETAALFRYQEYPMDHSTGLPQISIPLFTIQNGSLSVPISISYHASGFKVTDVDGPIASGWSLNVGGMVSRTIHGDPDFGIWPFPDDFNPYLNTPGQNTLHILEQVTHSDENPVLVPPGDYKDSEYDIFSYNFGNHSGKFIFKDEDGVKTPIFLDQKPLIVSPNTDSNGLSGLEIKDDHGNHYSFVGQENVATDVYNYTGFALKRIVSANLKDTITYTYGGAGKQYRRYISQYEVLEDSWCCGDYVDPIHTPGQTFENDNAQEYDIYRITEIDFEQGTLEFVLHGGIGQDKNLIDHIQLKDRNGKLIRKVKFNRAPLHSILAVGGTTNLQTHKLTSIEIQDQNENPVEHYAFDYYNTIYAGQHITSKIIDTRFIDYWGYYNASGDVLMVPRYEVIPIIFSSNSSGEGGNPNPNHRKPNINALKSGVLKKVYYPTGGSAEFIYEHNKYKDSETGSTENGPGLRVKQIINSDGNGNTVKRTFEYSNSAESITEYGDIDLEPKVEFMRNRLEYRSLPDTGPDHQERTFYSGFIPSLSELASRPIRYNFVTEYKGDASDNIGKTVYEYDNLSWSSLKNPLPNGQGGSFDKWHIHQYRYWDTPVLKNQTDYLAMKDANGLVTGYNEIRKLVNSYAPVESQTILGLHVQRNYMFPQIDQQVHYPPPNDHISVYVEQAIYDSGEPVFSYGPYSISVGTKNLASTTETVTNEDGNTITKQTTYGYNGYNLISEVNTITSKVNGTTQQNFLTKKEIDYPFDFSTTTLNSMTNLNMLNYKVEERDYYDGGLLNSAKTTYKSLDATTFVPEIMESSKGTNNPLEPRVTYHEHDTLGNPLEVSKANGPHTCYVWGYHGTLPIAKIANASYNTMTSAQLALITDAETASNADDDNCKDPICKEEILRDKLRLLREGFTNSQVATYTFDPLIGVTSMTDARGYTIYYSYDAFNRLKEVRDADGNLVTDHEYSYKQPNSN